MPISRDKDKLNSVVDREGSLEYYLYSHVCISNARS